jgi:hypothetical protein
MGMKPAEDFADDVGEERPEEAGDGEEGGDEFFRGGVGLSTGGGGGAGEMVGAKAVAEGAAVAALSLGAEVEAGALITGLGLSELHVAGFDAEVAGGAGGRRDGEFAGGMDLEGGAGFGGSAQGISLSG